MATSSEILASIDAQISTILESPDEIADYRIGDKAVKKSQILGSLLKARAMYRVAETKEPYEAPQHIALDITEFGEDDSEEVGDEQ